MTGTRGALLAAAVFSVVAMPAAAGRLPARGQDGSSRLDDVQSGPVRDAPTPRLLPPPTSAPRPAGRAGDVADAVETLISSIDGRCLAKVARLGDVGKLRSGLSTRLKIEKYAEARAMTWATDSFASYVGVHGAMAASLYVPVDLRKLRLAKADRVMLWRETTHHLEWLNGNDSYPDSRAKGAQERNTMYMEGVEAALSSWAAVEAEFMDGRRSPDVSADRDPWQAFARRMDDLERGAATSKAERAEGRWWPPDAKLELWTGFRARFADVRDLYRSGACGGALQRLAWGDWTPAEGPGWWAVGPR